MSTQIRLRLNRWGPLALMLLVLTAAVVLTILLPVRAQGALDPCTTTKVNYDQAKTDADAADKAFKKLKEPDWSKLPKGYEQYFDPSGQDPLQEVDRGKRVEAVLKKLQDDLQKNKKTVENLTLKQLQADLKAAEARMGELNKQYESRLSKLREVDTALVKLDEEIEAIRQDPAMATSETQELIQDYKDTIKGEETRVKALVGGKDLDMDAAQFRVNNSAFKDFISDDITKAKRDLGRAESAGIADEIAKAKETLNQAIENARQEAKDALTARATAAERLDQYKPAQDLLDAIAEKEREKGQKIKERLDLLGQKPQLKEVNAAYSKTVEAQDKLKAFKTATKEIPLLEARIAAIEPWFNALRKKDQTEQRLEQAKTDYGDAIAAKDKALERAKAGLKAEQARINRTQTSLQGQVKDQAYYQKLSQMILHARATYELILLNLVDLDCFGDVRNFMDDLKQRMKKLDEAREQILKQASAAAKPVAVRGAFGRTGVVPGKLPPNVDVNDFKLSASMSVNTFSVTYEMKPPYNGTGTVSQTWKGTLKATLKPGDILELSCATKVTRSGVDAPNVAGSCAWGVEGSIEVLENGKCWAGVASDGQFYPTCEGKFKFKVLPGQPGATLTIRATRGGHYWGNGDAGWNPVEVKYKFNP